MTASPGTRLLAFAREVGDGDLPKPVVELARLAVLDWWGVAVGGAMEPVARWLRDVELDGVPAGPASVLGTGRTAPPITAALLNGTAAHALDFDDTHLDLPGHVTAPILPGLLAIGESRRLGGRALLTAFVLGVEVMCRLGRALRPGHYRAGWHATATLGRLGGAVAAARLLGLEASRLDAAVGLAAAQAAGVQESFGTMAKPFQVGRAAGDALRAALAAEAGLTGAAGVLDREAWARRLSPDWRPAELTAGLGERFALTEVLFKRYPCCFATHAALRGLLTLAPVDADAIDRVDLAVCPTTLQVADQREPRTGLGGKFSMTHCAAVALVRGRVDEEAFTDAAVGDPGLRGLAARIRLAPVPDLDETRARVAVRLRGGATREAAADLRAGDDLADLERDLVGKFRGLVEPRLGAAETERLLGGLARLENAEDLAGLTGGAPAR
jgi:2-methylcitrate dehydratase PrpD